MNKSINYTKFCLLLLFFAGCKLNSPNKNMFKSTNGGNSYEKKENINQRNNCMNDDDRYQKWACSSCTYLNPNSLSYCEICNTRRAIYKNNLHNKPKPSYNNDNNFNAFAHDEKSDDQLSSKININKLHKEVTDAISSVSNESIFNKLQYAKVMLVFGPLGSGKSTIINYLLGNKLNKYFKPQINNKYDDINYRDNPYKNSNYNDEGNKEEEYRIEVENQLVDGPKIGHSLGKAETTYPCPYLPYNNHQKLCFCDSPGFFDNRGLEKLVATFVANNMLIQSCDKVNAICLVITKGRFEIDRGEPFIKAVIKVIQNMFDDNLYQDPLRSVFLLFNKMTSNNKQAYIYVIKKLCEYKNDFQQNIQHNSNFKDYIDVINRLLKYKNFLIIKPLDNGQTKNMAIDKLFSSIPIPKNHFKLIGSNSTKEELIRLEKDAINHTFPLLKKLENDKSNIINLVNTFNELEKLVKAKEIEFSNIAKQKSDYLKLNTDYKNNIDNAEKAIKNTKKSIRINDSNRQKMQREYFDKLNFDNDDDFSEFDKDIFDKKNQLRDLIMESETSKMKISRLRDKQESLLKNKNKLKHDIVKGNEKIKKENKENEKIRDRLLENCTAERFVEIAKDEKGDWFDYHDEYLSDLAKWADINEEFKFLKKIRNNIQECIKRSDDKCIKIDMCGQDFICSALSLCSSYLAIARDDSSIILWDCNKRKRLHIFELDSEFEIVKIEFNYNSTLLAFLGISAIGIFDLSLKKIYWQRKCEEEGTIDIAFHPNENTFYFLENKNKNTYLYFFKTYCPHNITCKKVDKYSRLRFSLGETDNKLIMVNHETGKISIWNKNLEKIETTNKEGFLNYLSKVGCCEDLIKSIELEEEGTINKFKRQYFFLSKLGDDKTYRDIMLYRNNIVTIEGADGFLELISVTDSCDKALEDFSSFKQKYALFNYLRFKEEVSEYISKLKKVIISYYNSKIKDTNSEDNNLEEINKEINDLENQIKSQQITKLKESINQVDSEIQILEYQQKQEKKNKKTAKKQEINSHIQNLTQLDQDIISSRDAIDDQEDIIKTNQRNIQNMHYQIKIIEEKMKSFQMLISKKKGEQKSLLNHLKLINTTFYSDLDSLRRNTKLADLLLKIEKVIPLNQFNKHNFKNLYQDWTNVKDLKDCLSEDIKKDLDSLTKRYIQKRPNKPVPIPNKSKSKSNIKTSNNTNKPKVKKNRITNLKNKMKNKDDNCIIC